MASGWLLLFAHTGAAGEKLPKHARYFSDSFAAAFDDLRVFYQLGMACSQKFAAGCGRRLDEKVPGFRANASLIPLITVFGSAEDSAASSQSDDEARILARMRVTREKLERDLFAYDRDFLKRFGAIAAVCPHRDDLNDAVQAVSDVTFLRYW